MDILVIYLIVIVNSFLMVILMRLKFFNEIQYLKDQRTEFKAMIQRERTYKHVSIQGFIDMALKELEREENITAVVLKVEFSFEVMHKKIMSQVASKRITWDDYDEKMHNRAEKRIYLSYDSPDTSRYNIMEDFSSFIENNAYVSYEDVYKRFALYERDVHEMLKNKIVLKQFLKDQLASHFADTIAR